MRFTLLPSSFSDETPIAYLMRSFDINGMAWSAHRIRSAGHPYQKIMNGSNPEIHLGAFGLKADHVRKLVHLNLDWPNATIAGQPLDRDDWTTAIRRWCPKCWEEDLRAPADRQARWNIHRRFWWDVQAISTCPFHKVQLLKSCPACDPELERPVGWHHGSLTRCTRGHSLLRCESQAVTEDDAAADLYIVGRLTGARQIGSDFLDALPLDLALSVIKRFGIAAVHGPYAKIRGSGLDRNLHVMSAGFRVASEWPTNYVGLLDALASSAPGWGAKVVYGRLYRWAKSIPSGSRIENIKSILFDHCAGRAYLHESSYIRRSHSSKFVGIRSLAAQLDRHPKVIAKCLEELGAKSSGPGRGNPESISAKNAKQVEIIVSRRLKRSDLNVLLGTSSRNTQMLISKGLITPGIVDPLLSRKIDDFDKLAVEQFLQKLRGSAPLVKEAGQDVFSMADIAKRLRMGSIAEVCDFMVRADLTASAVLENCKGIPSLLFDARSVEEAKVRIFNSLNSRQAARELGISLASLSIAINNDVLTRTLNQYGESRIPLSEVVRFWQIYTTPSILAKEYGTSARVVQRVMRKCDVAPILSSTHNWVFILYRLADVPRDFAREVAMTRARVYRRAA